MLDLQTFRAVVASAPLIAIDLVVRDTHGEILLGRRRNRPAQGCWFVPGGRVRKNESLDDAFRRVALVELGRPFERGEARWIGVFEHFYADSAFGEDGPDTHYVVLTYLLNLPAATLALPNDQHDEFRWWAPEAVLADPAVHEHSRAYLHALNFP